MITNKYVFTFLVQIIKFYYCDDISFKLINFIINNEKQLFKKYNGIYFYFLFFDSH